jgi:signal transduction histidine kinase/CHASE3 domain sensor protein
MTMSAAADPGAAPPSPARRRTVAVHLRHTLLAVIGLVLLLGSSGAVGAQLSRSAASELRRLDGLALANQRLGAHIVDADVSWRAFLTTGDDALLDAFDRSASAWGQDAADARALAGGDTGVLDLVDRQEELARRWLDADARPAVDRRRTNPGGAAAGAATDDGRFPLDELRGANGRAASMIDGQRQAAADRVDATHQGVAVALLVSVLVGATVGLLLLRRVDVQVLRPLDDLTRTMARLTSGDLAARTAPGGAGELVALGRATNELAGQVETLRLAELQRADHDRAMSRVSRAIREHLEVAPALDAAAREVGHALQADRVVVRGLVVETPGQGRLGPVLSVWDRPEGARRVPAAHGTRVRSPAPFATSATRSLTELVGQAFVGGSLFWVDDAWTDERLDEKTRRWFDAGNVRSVVVVPVKTGETAYIMIVQSRGVPRTWTEPELTLLGAVARDLAVALQHAQLYARERGTVAELTELDRAKAEFVDSVARELGTPLADVVNYTGLLRAGDAGPLTPVQDGMVRVVERNTDRLLQLIDDLLTVARIEAGALALHPVDIEPAAIIRKTVEAMRPTLDDRHLALDVEVSEHLPALRADPEQMGRALRNVLTNAADFSRDGGTVRLRATASDEEITFAVADDGAGGPASEPDAFARFFHSSPPARGGADERDGLGLTVVKLVVEGHGGSVDITSEPGEGTTVNVRLPVEPSDLAAPA